MVLCSYVLMGFWFCGFMVLWFYGFGNLPNLHFLLSGRSWSHLHDFQGFIKRIGGIFRCPSFRKLTNIRHRAARHQWIVIILGLGSQSWDLGSLNCFEGPQDSFPDFPGFPAWLFCRTFCCCDFSYPVFLTLHQKASQNGVQIDPKSMKNDVGSHLEKSVRKCT